ncbi:MAG TPA: transcriptional activator NhaR [Planctomycetota bacterium]|nr:transcriptional activator NhaR [Planctomycetota bacterium]
MDWFNYHHLLYFWVVAREGSIARACQELRLAQPTVSSQLRKLERSLGEKLFARSGRGLVLTDVGRLVYGYAEEIFSLGKELGDVLAGRPTGRPLRLVVGVTEVMTKLVAFRLIEPALGIGEPLRIVCREAKAEELLSRLALHELDVVLTHSPLGPGVRVRAFNHLLGECAIAFFATPALAARHRRRFPRSLDGAPLLLPTEGTTLRRSLDQWFSEVGVQPEVAGEFDGENLMKVFGQAGRGIFPAPAVVEREIARQYGVRVVGRADAVRERFYAVSLERKLRHPAVIALSEAARKTLS